MHKPEEPLPFPFHVRIFVIIPFLLLLSLSPKHQQPRRRRLRENGGKNKQKKLKIFWLLIRVFVAFSLFPYTRVAFFLLLPLTLSVTLKNVFIMLVQIEKKRNDLRDWEKLFFSIHFVFHFLLFLLTCAFVFLRKNLFIFMYETWYRKAINKGIRWCRGNSRLVMAGVDTLWV